VVEGLPRPVQIRYWDEAIGGSCRRKGVVNKVLCFKSFRVGGGKWTGNQKTKHETKGDGSKCA